MEEESKNENKPTSSLDQLVEENLKVSQEILKLTKSIKNYVILQRVLGVFKLLLILIPIILGLYYLPPLIQKAFEPYQELLGSTPFYQNQLNNAGLDLSDIDLNKVSPDKIRQIREILK